MRVFNVNESTPLMALIKSLDLSLDWKVDILTKTRLIPVPRAATTNCRGASGTAHGFISLVWNAGVASIRKYIKKQHSHA